VFTPLRDPADTAQLLGINRVFPGERIWLGEQWFYVTGILHPAVLDPNLDYSVLVGFPAAEHYLGFDGHPSTIYVRTQTSQVSQVNRVQSLLAATADPEAPTTPTPASPRPRCSPAPTRRPRSTACSSASARWPCSSAPSA
jgi:putative ABC transport system permease protein